MILSACNQAVNCALKANAMISSTGRSVHFHETDDNTLEETNEIQEQVNNLQLYRDTEQGEESYSGSSSDKST